MPRNQLAAACLIANQSMVFRRTCKETAALLIAREDRALSFSDRISLRLHLAACKTCPVFERQVLTMREALGRWRKDDPES
jgi:hypothetical protein